MLYAYFTTIKKLFSMEKRNGMEQSCAQAWANCGAWNKSPQHSTSLCQKLPSPWASDEPLPHHEKSSGISAHELYQRASPTGTRDTWSPVGSSHLKIRSND